MALRHNTATLDGSPQEALARTICGRTTGTGDFETPIAGLSFFRREGLAPPAVCVVEPSIVLVAQGAKQLWVGGEAYRYDTSRFLVTSLDLPANSEVMAASPERPCVGLTLKLEPISTHWRSRCLAASRKSSSNFTGTVPGHRGVATSLLSADSGRIQATRSH
ncbi:AraC family transcriptional regulator [Collimonas sp. OK412]|jgi:hypothetical protein|uniref:AraC family transcriptional regulator n=1 Tax=Collimonas sp. (strain OK412) TaxID=1801619 RepID=UPI000B850B2D